MVWQGKRAKVELVSLTPPVVASVEALNTSGGKKPATTVQAVARFCKRKPLGAIGGVILVVLVLIALLAPVIAPHDPYTPNAAAIYAVPGSVYLLGADEAGRDVMSRLFYGARISLYVSLASVLIGFTSGALLGILSAYIGGWFDLIIQRIIDALMAFPTIILALGIMAVLGASVHNVILALIFVIVPGTARTVRSQALSVKALDYIIAAGALGGTHGRIILRHMVPNLFAMCLILATLQLGLAILTESSLSFLGVGVPPDVPTWGGMLREAARAFVGVAPWLAIFPGLTIALAVFGVNLLGDALRDVLDPRLRSDGGAGQSRADN